MKKLCAKCHKQSGCYLQGEQKFFRSICEKCGRHGQVTVCFGYDFRPALRAAALLVDTSRFDPHALAMALQLAELLWDDPDADIIGVRNRRYVCLSEWLRAEVARELEAQP